MENLVEKLNAITSDYKTMNGDVKPETLMELKQREFDLFGEIRTIRELSEYYKTDMTLDGMPELFINGMYSGVVNGAMFVINEIKRALDNDWNDGANILNSINSKLEEIQGLN